MPTALSKLFSLSALAFLAGAVACTGMSPGGGGGSPAEVAQGGGGAPVAIGNSLDSAGPNGPGPNLGGDTTGGGEAQPSTQQSTEGIGAPCIINFQVRVKTTRNGVPEACSNAVARMQLEDFNANDGDMAPPDLPPAGPMVTMKFLFIPEDNPFNITDTKGTQCIGGTWESDNFLFRYPGKGLDCSSFHQVTAQASWYKNGQTLNSSTFQGPPLPSPDENFTTLLEVTLELNGSVGGGTTTHNADVNPGTVLSY